MQIFLVVSDVGCRAVVTTTSVEMAAKVCGELWECHPRCVEVTYIGDAAPNAPEWVIT